jgi:hypothetical protein
VTQSKITYIAKTIKVPDVEEPDLIANLQIVDWLNSSQGKFCLDNKIKITYLSSIKDYYLEYQIILELTQKELCFYHLLQ